MTFKEFDKKYKKIKIPLLQRDYVQVSNANFCDFLKKIKRALEGGCPLHLGLIYGRVENDCFYPIDGQQRLTTLYLILNSSKLCYENNFYSENKPNLDNHLEENEISKGTHPHKKAIQEALNKIKKLEITSENLCNITLDLVELNDFDLSDELYIKLNARGKALDEFDIFRANTLNVLKDKKDKDELARKIDNEWSDIFYEHFKEKCEKAFLAFFDFITEHLAILGDIEEFKKDRIYSCCEFKKIFKYFEVLELIFSNYNECFDVCTIDKTRKISLDRLGKNKHFLNALLTGCDLNKQNKPERIKWVLFFYCDCMLNKKTCEYFKLYARELNNKIQSLGQIWSDNGFTIDTKCLNEKVKVFLKSNEGLKWPSENEYFYLLEKHKYFYADVSLLEKCDYEQVYKKINKIFCKQDFLKELIAYADIKRDGLGKGVCFGYGFNEYEIDENLMLNILFTNRTQVDNELKEQISNFFASNGKKRDLGEDLISKKFIEIKKLHEDKYKCRYGMLYKNEDGSVFYMKNKQYISKKDDEEIK